MDELYTFVYKGLLTEESLDKVGRQRRRHVGPEDLAKLRRELSFDMLDPSLMNDAQRMSVVYTAIHSFENMVRQLVAKAMSEKFAENWWLNVPEKIEKKVKVRIEEDGKFRWHGARGAKEINYCDFGDLSSIIVSQWSVFEVVLGDMEWAK